MNYDKCLKSAADAANRESRLNGNDLVIYGNCPICGAEAVNRERRLNGNDVCKNGHTYPSKEAIQTIELGENFLQELAQLQAKTTKPKWDEKVLNELKYIIKYTKLSQREIFLFLSRRYPYNELTYASTRWNIYKLKESE
jgi:hypothetical protein